MRKTLKLAVITSLILSVLIIVLTNLWADVIVEIFNSERNPRLAAYAVEGVSFILWASCLRDLILWGRDT